MKKNIFLVLSKFPILGKIIDRKYYATGIGVLFVNYLFKKVFRINASTDLLFHFTSQTNCPKNIRIDTAANNSKTVYLSFATSGSCYYQAINGIEIGEGTIWAPGCKFISANHSFKDLTKNIKTTPIIIGKNVWIASNVVILPTIHIGDYCVVGAGSIVTKSFDSYLIIAGNPAKAIASRCLICLDKIPLGQSKCSAC